MNEQLKGDLGFVRAAVERGELSRNPAVLYYLWAVLTLCGFALGDLRREWVDTYWAVAAPGGFVLSAVLGWYYARRHGGLSRAIGARQMLHWGGLIAAVFLAGLLPSEGAPILLLLALGYFLAGVHLDRAMLWIGLLMAGGYILVLQSPAYAWTTVGVGVATGLLLAGLRPRRTDGIAAA